VTIGSAPDARLRVARIIARLNVGGPARHVVWLTEALNDEEFESVLVTGTVPAGEEDMSDFAAAHGVTPVVFTEMSREISPRDLATIWKLFRFFRRFRPHIVHTHTAKAGSVGRAAATLYRWTAWGGRQRCQVVHTFHGHIFHSYYGRLKTAIFLLVERALAPFTDRIVVLSRQQLDEIHGTFRVGRKDQFAIVPLGVDLTALTASQNTIRTELGIRDEEIVVGIIGRLTGVKNHRMFLEVGAAMREAPASRPVRFVIFGEGADRAGLEQTALDLALESVIFAGLRDAGSIYAAVDLVALTSLNEGTPLTLIEGMAAGRPIVSTAVGGVVDLLGNVEDTERTASTSYEVRERGLTVPSNDVVAFAAALRRLIDDEELRARFAERGKSFAFRTYSKERLIADIINLYRELREHSAAQGA
jgi:glycosyltransferase involved in cell wall biosynthesis